MEFHSQNRTWEIAQHLLDTDDLADGADINENDGLFRLPLRLNLFVNIWPGHQSFISLSDTFQLVKVCSFKQSVSVFVHVCYPQKKIFPK